ncbi:hypothetical protein ACFSJ3_15975 [Corallincola platygyrae]|uniref:Cyanobacterial TRADD-N associated 2 transmembrane domain-containing protein n=2 Tax=Corallincola platygyrae TaxID=1193278 RepID=A0ABW4XQR0_9GAMM
MFENISIGFWLELAQIFIIPITIIVLSLLFRPFLRELISRATKFEVKSIDFHALDEFKEGKEDEGIASLASRGIEEGLKEGSKEKLEKLRLALETEQVSQVIQYHQNSLAQSRISFWFSIGAGTLGFLVIIVGALMAMAGVQSTTSILTVVSGTIIDAIAALFFTQSNQARKLMTEFFDKLRVDRQFNESLRLCESIPDESTQSQLKARLSLFFAGVPADTVYEFDKHTEANNPIQPTPKDGAADS